MKLKGFDGDNAAIHDEFENIPTNTSGNKPFSQVLSEGVSRRDVLGGSLAAAVASFLAPQDVFANSKSANGAGGLVNFPPVTRAQYTAESLGGTIPVISDDYTFRPLIPWGTPINSLVAEYTGDPNTRPTSMEQETQASRLTSACTTPTTERASTLPTSLRAL